MELRINRVRINRSRPVLGRLEKGDDPLNRKFVFTREANYHPNGGQVFFPVTKEPFVLLLALPGDDIKLEDFVAFYCDGSCGVQIKVQDLSLNNMSPILN